MATTYHVCKIESNELAAKGFKFSVCSNDSERGLVESEQIAARKGRLYRTRREAFEAAGSLGAEEAFRSETRSLDRDGPDEEEVAEQLEAREEE